MIRKQDSDEHRALRQAIGQVISSVRASAGLATQASLAERIGVSRQYVTSMEAGAENLTLETLSGIVDALGLTMADFLNRVVAELRAPSPPRPDRRGRPPRKNV